MATRLGTRDDVMRRSPAVRYALHDHLVRTAEARRLQAETIAEGVHWLWTKGRRAWRRLMNGKPHLQTVAADRRDISRSLGRASVAEALRRDRLRLARLVRRSILEPFRRRRRRDIAIARLSVLDDRLLADIGLTRGQIELAVDGKLASHRDRFSPPVERPRPAEEPRHELPLAA